ncbi:hypothetical protein DYB32_009004 [Aphanomyces invadans]|uniref:Regulator of microtubule dynamics protein 1 n=1 Tax=Aphanomyces invadans TaxID=157072 RepID=A0A418AJT1_9STRA|nr:hypothetical protein DYB32_009004 [Aphanomyces invadans]
MSWARPALLAVAGVGVVMGTVLVYRYATRGLGGDRPQDEEEIPPIGNVASTNRNVASSARSAPPSSAPAVEVVHAGATTTVSIEHSDPFLPTTEERLEMDRLVVQEGNMLLSLFGVVFLAIVLVVASVVVLTSNESASPTATTKRAPSPKRNVTFEQNSPSPAPPAVIAAPVPDHAALVAKADALYAEGDYHAVKSFLDENLPNDAMANKWMGIMLSSVGNYRDTSEKIKGAYKIKLNPNDATAHNILGQWCLAFANLGWLEKQAATVLFGKPPTASYDDAVRHFHDAGENSFLLADTYFKMGNAAEAKLWLAKADAVPVKTTEDREVQGQIDVLGKALK